MWWQGLPALIPVLLSQLLISHCPALGGLWSGSNGHVLRLGCLGKNVGDVGLCH